MRSLFLFTPQTVRKNARTLHYLQKSSPKILLFNLGILDRTIQQNVNDLIARAVRLRNDALQRLNRFILHSD